MNFPRPLALVTGASSGVGAALARELARDGHDLVLVSRREAPLRTLAAELAAGGARAAVLATNLGAFGAAARLTADLERRGLSVLDVLVNAAGFGDYTGFTEAEPTTLAEMIQVNVTAPTELARTFLPGMVARGRGRVLLVAALAGFAPGPGAAVYHATKAYVLSLGEALAHELRGSGATVTTLCPGPTRTGFARAAGGEDTLLYRGRLAEPAAVAREGYAALRRGCRVWVPGWRSRLAAAACRFAPRAALLRALAEQNGAR